MRKVNYILPKSWKELTSKQLLFVAKLFCSDFAKRDFLFLTHAFAYFAKLKVKYVQSHQRYVVKSKGEKPYLITTSQLLGVLDRLHWLLDEITELTPLPMLRKAKAVHPRLYNTKFIRFLTAEIFYTAYSKQQKVEHLNQLCAVLYDRKNQSFDDGLVKKRARYFRYVSFYKKYTVFIWYSGFRWYVAQECPNMFEGEGTGDLSIKDHVKNMIRGLTEGDVTKNEKVTKNVQTWDALYELDAKVTAINKLKSKK